MTLNHSNSTTSVPIVVEPREPLLYINADPASPASGFLVCFQRADGTHATVRCARRDHAEALVLALQVRPRRVRSPVIDCP